MKKKKVKKYTTVAMVWINGEYKNLETLKDKELEEAYINIAKLLLNMEVAI